MDRPQEATFVELLQQTQYHVELLHALVFECEDKFYTTAEEQKLVRDLAKAFNLGTYNV